jgi:hypothetical protein
MVMLTYILSWICHCSVGQQLVLRRLVLLLVMSNIGRVMVMMTMMMGMDGDGYVTTVMHGRAMAIAIVAPRRRLLARGI